MLAALWRAPGVAPRRFGAFQRRDAPLMLAPCTNTSEIPWRRSLSPPHLHHLLESSVAAITPRDSISHVCTRAFSPPCLPLRLSFRKSKPCRASKVKQRNKFSTLRPERPARPVKVPVDGQWGVAALFASTFLHNQPPCIFRDSSSSSRFENNRYELT